MMRAVSQYMKGLMAVPTPYLNTWWVSGLLKFSVKASSLAASTHSEFASMFRPIAVDMVQGQKDKFMFAATNAFPSVVFHNLLFGYKALGSASIFRGSLPIRGMCNYFRLLVGRQGRILLSSFCFTLFADARRTIGWMDATHGANACLDQLLYPFFLADLGFLLTWQASVRTFNKWNIAAVNANTSGLSLFIYSQIAFLIPLGASFATNASRRCRVHATQRANAHSLARLVTNAFRLLNPLPAFRTEGLSENWLAGTTNAKALCFQ
jgi:hypothetical protein